MTGPAGNLASCLEPVVYAVFALEEEDELASFPMFWAARPDTVKFYQKFCVVKLALSHYSFTNFCVTFQATYSSLSPRTHEKMEQEEHVP